MSKIPDGLTLVRMDTNIYNQFKEYCDEEGFVVSKHLGFKIRDFLRDKDWVPMEVKESESADQPEEFLG
ncbi:hypothetical protein LCGC14_0622630 [marine sediment metagenome]|uniref:Uncharacterized protein n=1 Tax=marine sediment metagenome TaxID=412755 RepID=A0A0F9RNP9_9ZZZZ